MPRPRRPRHPVLLAVGLLVLLVLVGGVLAAYDAATAYRSLKDARTEITTLRTDVTGGRVDRVQPTVQRLRQDTTEADAAVHGPHWWVLAHLPVVGDDVTAVRTVTGMLADLTEDAAGPLAEAAQTLTPEALVPQDGRVPLGPVEQVAPLVRRGDAGVRAAVARLGTVSADGLAGPVADVVTELDDQLTELSGQTSLARRLTMLLPPMLGADGPRRYLLLSQNNAEARSLGGIVGAAILVTADDGRIELRRQVAGNEFPQLDEPVLPLSDGEVTLYDEQLGLFLLNATNTPDFPRAAELAAARWKRSVGQQVDGVASVDPGALALLLRATGPVEVAGTRLTPDNTPELLLNEVYRRIPDPAAQDAFFAAAASAIFDRIAAGDADVRAAATASAAAVDEGRLLLWSRRADEERVLRGSRIAGELVGRDGDRPVVGVFLNEQTASKLSWYENASVRVTDVGCGEGDARLLRVRASLTSTVPTGGRARSRLPDYVTGVQAGAPRGTLRTRVVLYAPTGGLVESVRLVGGSPGAISTTHDGLAAVARDVVVPPGETVAVEAEMSVPPKLTGNPSVRHTPLARNEQLTSSTFDCRS